MKHLKEYKLWEQSRELTPEQEGFLNRYVRGTWGINSEGLVDVEGDFDCAREGLNNFQGIRFGTVSGDFNCSSNQRTSLEGAPREVKGNFDCNMNPISDQTIELICQKMMENPEMGYGAILASLQSRIPREDWEKLDKSSLDKMNQTRIKVYGMLGGIGGI